MLNWNLLNNRFLSRLASFRSHWHCVLLVNWRAPFLRHCRHCMLLELHSYFWVVVEIMLLKLLLLDYWLGRLNRLQFKLDRFTFISVRKLEFADVVRSYSRPIACSVHVFQVSSLQSFELILLGLDHKFLHCLIRFSSSWAVLIIRFLSFLWIWTVFNNF